MAIDGCGGGAPRLLAHATSVDSVADHIDGSSSDAPDRLRFKASVCDGVSLRVERGTLAPASIAAMLREAGLTVSEVPARTDLVYLDIQGADLARPIRLRVAVLASAEEAAQELHTALLQLGHGAWGFHRANLAVLGSSAAFEDVLVFAAKTKLACRGVLTVVKGGRAFVVSGAYSEP
jgi:hypothetical protein